MTCDTLQTADVAVYHFEKMFAVCKLWPGFFLTISQYAMASAFFNTKHPTNANAPLSMPVLTQEVSETFTPALIGGYSSVNSVFHNPSNAILDNTPTTTASFFMGPEAGSEAFLCFLPPSHGSQIAFLPPRLCYSIFPYKLPFAPVTSSQKPRLIPFLIFPLPPPHLVFIPCISSLCSLGFSGLELTSSTSSHFFSFPLLSFCTSVF